MAKFIEEFEDKNYDMVEVFDKPALLFQCRLEDIPKNLYHYDLRGTDDDWGDIHSISPKKVVVNFVGTVVMMEQLNIDKETDVDINFIESNIEYDIKDEILQHAYNTLYYLESKAFFLCWLNNESDHYNVQDCNMLMEKILPEFKTETRLVSLFEGLQLINDAEDKYFKQISDKWKQNEYYDEFPENSYGLSEIVGSMDWDIYAPHGCFRNEVEPPKYIAELLDVILNLSGGVLLCESKILVELYDFGDYPLNFDSLEKAEHFLNRFNLVPYSVYENDGNNGWIELYTA